MVDPDLRHAGQHGFTLVEMLAALGILLFGVVALLGSLSTSIAQRRTTDARHELTALCEHAVHRVRHEAIRLREGGSTPLDLDFVPLLDQPAPGFAGMRWSATAIADESRPDVWLLRIEVRWLEGGDSVDAVFLRVVPRQAPLRDRVFAFRGQVPETSNR
jgi:prepilin-type N-terminal cleavage/methylation domain-containing protein